MTVRLCEQNVPNLEDTPIYLKVVGARFRQARFKVRHAVAAQHAFDPPPWQKVSNTPQNGVTTLSPVPRNSFILHSASNALVRCARSTDESLHAASSRSGAHTTCQLSGTYSVAYGGP